VLTKSEVLVFIRVLTGTLQERHLGSGTCDCRRVITPLAEKAPARTVSSAVVLITFHFFVWLGWLTIAVSLFWL